MNIIGGILCEELIFVFVEEVGDWWQLAHPGLLAPSQTSPSEQTLASVLSIPENVLAVRTGREWDGMGN